MFGNRPRAFPDPGTIGDSAMQANRRGGFGTTLATSGYRYSDNVVRVPPDNIDTFLGRMSPVPSGTESEPSPANLTRGPR